MIYTLTLNPAIDYSVSLDRFLPGEINRATAERICAGGKGINVSIVLKNLGIPNVALGFVAGQTGLMIEENARGNGCTTDFIRLDEGFSRINVKIQASEDSAVNGVGPQIGREAMARLYEKLSRLEEGDTLVLAGSVPGQLSADIYRQIIRLLAGRGIRFVVDATGALLTNVLEYAPFLIKPNEEELGELFGVGIRREEEVVYYAQRLHEQGAQNVLVSRGSAGAVLVAQDGQILIGEAPPGRAVDAVGAGDSMVAGFLAGYERSGDPAEAFRWGIAAGSASAFSERLATREQIFGLLPSVRVLPVGEPVRY